MKEEGKMNQIWLIGRLTTDPTLAYTQAKQTPVCKFNLAVDRKRRSSTGESETDFFRVTVFGKAAETHMRYLSKGKQVAIVGTVQTGSYKNRDGVTIYTTDVIAEDVKYLSYKNENGGSSEHPKKNDASEQKQVQFTEDDMVPAGFDVDCNDIPF